jgi:4'-phosphopantetheinyl transferase
MKLHFTELKKIDSEKRLPPRGNQQGEVHVWRHDLHYDDPFLRESPYLLSSEELQRAQKYHFEKDRRVYESGHVFIRKVLAHYCGMDPAQLVLSPIVNQKPRLENAPFHIYFNISHASNRILIAVGFQSDVGIDVERIIPDFDTDGFAEANYHPNEMSHLQTLKGDDELKYFYFIWTRKEAWLKLTGEGVNEKLRELDFSGVKPFPSLPPHGHHDLYMTSWSDTDDYIATLAAYTDSKNIRFFGSSLLLE